MAEEVKVKCCSNLGCDQPGTSCCSACKTTFYCGPTCQTADWPKHREECDGHLRKVGMANLKKAEGFQDQRNWMQVLRHGEIAAIKLKQLKDRRLETVELIDSALTKKFNALQRLDRHKEALECIKERYTLWAMNHLRNPGSMRAALGLIQSCIHNEEFEDAERYARHAYFMIAEMTDNFIPSEEQPQFLAEVSHWLSLAIYQTTNTGGIPPAEKQEKGEEAITHARKALEMFSQLNRADSTDVARAMSSIASILDYFNDVDDDEILHRFKQSIGIFRRLEGTLSVNVAVCENSLGIAYGRRAQRARSSKDLDRCKINLELALPHFRESARIYTAINHVESANDALRNIARAEKQMREI